MSVFEKFTVIDLIKTRSASVATISDGYIKFNTQTAEELHYPPFVQLLVNPKEKQFGIRVCSEDAPNAVKFSKPEGEQRYPIRICTVAVADMIRKMANWDAEESWNVPGVYFAADEGIVYDLNAAVKPRAKAGRRPKAQEENEI
jgi:hypothetical protein